VANTGDETKLYLLQVIKLVEDDLPVCDLLAAALEQLASQLLLSDFSINPGTAALPITAQTHLSADAAAVQAGFEAQV